MSLRPADHSMVFLAGLLAGAVTGSVIGLLLAPRTGRQIRDTLGHELRRMVLKSSAIDLHQWSEVAEQEARRRAVANLERIRAAGL